MSEGTTTETAKKPHRRPFYLFKPDSVNEDGEKLFTVTRHTTQTDLVADLRASGIDATNVHEILLFRADSVHDQINLKTQTVIKFGKRKSGKDAESAPETAPAPEAATDPEGV
jgi:hypothetical protein